MKEGEFSETQFVAGYARELFNQYDALFLNYNLEMPSTRKECGYASDFIIRHLSSKYKYSEFYQFKKSALYDKGIITDRISRIKIDLSIKQYYGFKIYNKKTSKQFETLIKLGREPYNKVYYCAPMFHTFEEYNDYFKNKAILEHSRLIDFSDEALQNIKISYKNNHKIIFNNVENFVCSNITEVKGFNADERHKHIMDNNTNERVGLEKTIQIVKNCVKEYDEHYLYQGEKDYSDIFYLRSILASYLGIFWILYFKENSIL